MKTIEECKDEIAKKYNYDSFYQMLLDGGTPMSAINKRIDEAMILYANQFKNK